MCGTSIEASDTWHIFLWPPFFTVRAVLALFAVPMPVARSSSSPLLALPVELQALVAHHLSGPSFASLRLATRQMADAAGRYLTDRLCGAAGTYGSAAFSKALPHDELASWPVRSGALALLLPLEQWAATLSAASPLLELWLRHELPAHYLQLLRALGRLGLGLGLGLGFRVRVRATKQQ